MINTWKWWYNSKSPCCIYKAFSHIILTKMVIILKSFMHCIVWYTRIHRYLMHHYFYFAVSIHTWKHFILRCIGASQYCPISTLVKLCQLNWSNVSVYFKWNFVCCILLHYSVGSVLRHTRQRFLPHLDGWLMADLPGLWPILSAMFPSWWRYVCVPCTYVCISDVQSTK